MEKRFLYQLYSGLRGSLLKSSFPVILVQGGLRLRQMSRRRLSGRRLSRASRLVVRRQARLRQIFAVETISRAVSRYRLRLDYASAFFF